MNQPRQNKGRPVRPKHVPENPIPPPNDGLVSMPEVARRTGLSPSTLYGWRDLFPTPVDGLRGKQIPTKLYPEDAVAYAMFVEEHVLQGGVWREVLHYNEWKPQQRSNRMDETAHYRAC